MMQKTRSVHLNLSTNARLVPLDVKAGDRIIFSKYGGTDVKIEGEEFLIMREEDVLGIVEK